jgi:post-segregation antitoxin (ccd killing protein)
MERGSSESPSFRSSSASGALPRHGRAALAAGKSGVYNMRMARVNVYLPDDLADAAHAADLNISRLTQDAIRRELQQTGIQEWTQTVSRLARPRVSHAAVQKAIDAARDEFGTGRG